MGPFYISTLCQVAGGGVGVGGRDLAGPAVCLLTNQYAAFALSFVTEVSPAISLQITAHVSYWQVHSYEGVKRYILIPYQEAQY